MHQPPDPRILGLTMSQMRLNPLNGRWVTIVAERAERPSDFAPRESSVDDPTRPCPFCPGHEESTPPALETVEHDGSWSMRVIPNRYPAFDGDEAFAVHNLGPVLVMAEASGIHEVFVYTPDHDSGLHHLDDAHASAADARAARPFRRARRHPAGPLHPGDRQPRPRGRRLDRSSARSDPRSAVRARRDPRRGAGVRPLRRRLPAVHDRRSRVGRRRTCGLRQRRRRRDHPVLERRPVRTADRAPPPRAASPGRPRRQPRIGSVEPSATPSGTSTLHSATWRSTSVSTPHRTSTPASTTGTSTSGRTWSPRRASNAAPA